MANPTSTSLSITALAAIALALTAFVLFALNAHAQSPAKAAPPQAGIVGDADRGAEQYEATCAECHGAAATAPTLRGIIDRPIASVASYYGYSEAMKAKKPAIWTVANLDAYLKSPPKFAPGNLMNREYPDAQMRADIIAFLATLPQPR